MSRKYTETGISKIALSNAKFYATALESNEFRLLYYDAETDIWSFKTHTLSEGPPYVAISYTWGPNEDNRYAEEEVITIDDVTRDLIQADANQNVAIDDENEYSIQIEGETYAVSRNVYELSKIAIDHEIVYPVWIDALCINQADLEERSSQVRNMAQLFHDAEYVLTWLGADVENEAKDIINICKAIQAEFWRQVGDGGRNATAKRNPRVWEAGVLESMELPPANDDRWHTLARFFDRRWFHRVWILQEMVMARDHQLWWGSTIMDYQMLEDVSSFILNSEFPLFSKRPPFRNTYKFREWFVIKRKLGESLAKIHSFRLVVVPGPNDEDGQPYVMDSYDVQMDTVGGPKIIDGQLRQDCMRHWGPMLETNRSFDATDPRDYIYATYSIIDTAAANRGWTLSGIPVDYNRSVAEVYADAAKRIMETSQCVNLISLAQDPQMRKQKTLPSWVPDFSASGEMPILLPRGRRWKLMPSVYKMARSLHEASSPSFAVQDDLKTLKVNAIHLDTISMIGESHYQFTNGGMWEDIAKILLSRGSFVPGESRVESLWRTLVADTDIDGENRAGPEVGVLFESFVSISLVIKTYTSEANHLAELPTWQRLTEIHRAECNHDDEVALLPSFEYIREKVQYMDQVAADVAAGAPNPPQGPKHAKASIFAGATEPMFYRRIILTSSGHLGFGPMSTLPGDEIWLLPGVPLPTMLRKTGQENQYTVLGECYLHGNPDFSHTSGIEESRWIDLV